MKYYPISLEKAFLNRQFRPIRLLLVGKYLPRPSIKSKRTAELAQKALASVPQFFPAKKPELKTIFEQKKPLDVTSKPIDIVEPIHLRPTPTKKTVAFDLTPKTAPMKKKWDDLTPTKKGRVKKAVFGAIVAICLILLTILFAPSVYYTLFPGDSIPVITDANGTPLGGDFGKNVRVVGRVPTPPYEESLPEGNWLIIPKIGVNTQILEGETPDEALSKGVWRVHDFGTVTDLSKPMILAAHRYGWKAWWENGNQYWKYHSFYLLPDLQPGDVITVISEKRKYTYEVYAGEQGEEITDYNADLILYTCKFLDSPLRYFRYARLVDPNNPAALSSK